MIISGLGSPSLEDYGLRKWHQIAGVLKCRTPIYGCQTHVQASRQPASLTHAAIKQPHWNDGLGGYCSWRWRGSFQPSWFRTGWAGVRAGTPQGEGIVVGSCTYTDAVLHACFIQSRPQVQSIVTLEYCACVCAHTRVYVCVCVSICDSSITPTVRSTAWLPARHCSLAVFLIDILIGRFECRL